MNALSSPLGRLSAPSPLTVEEREAANRRLWRQHRRIFVGPEDGDLRAEEIEAIERIGERRYGRG